MGLLELMQRRFQQGLGARQGSEIYHKRKEGTHCASLLTSLIRPLRVIPLPCMSAFCRVPGPLLASQSKSNTEFISLLLLLLLLLGFNNPFENIHVLLGGEATTVSSAV